MERRRIETGCKTNLFLRVTGRRDDGYHTLETLFLPLRYPSDVLELTFDGIPGIRLSAGAGVPVGRDNLVFRAAELYARCAGIEPEWSISLGKHIPVAAGLGGGSADAAGVLRILEERYRLLGRQKLAAAALSLGADVPFFLDGVPAVARGVGEELSPLKFKLPRLHLLLVNPLFPVSAGWAYRHLSDSAENSGTLSGLLDGLAANRLAAVVENIRNDLAAALWKKFPLLRMIRSALFASGAAAVEVSGSGSTLFALMPDAGSMHSGAERISGEFPWAKVFETIGGE